MWHAKEYRRGEQWRWWQRLAPHRKRWDALRRAGEPERESYPWHQRLAHFFIPHPRNGYRPHAVRQHALWCYSFVLIAAKLCLSIGLFLAVPTPAYFSSLTALQIIALTNEARATAGIPPVVEHDFLRQSAQLKAEEMARLGYFAHTSPQGDAPWEWFKRVEYRYTYAGENLAMDFRNAEEVVKAWMESPRHRENILNPNYEDIGIAVTTGTVDGRTVTLVVQHFGATPRVELPPTFGARTAVEGTSGDRAVVAAAATAATLSQAQRAWWHTALEVFPWVVGVFSLWLVAQLMITLLVHIRIQHRGMVYATVLVIGIAVGLLYTRVHFLESIGSVPILF